MKSYLRFAGRVTAAHVVTYIGVGALASMALVVAGNDAPRTVKAFRAQDYTPHVVFEDGAPASGSNTSRSR